MPKVKAAMVVGLVAIILFSAAFRMALNAYQSESDDLDTLLVTGDTQNPDRVDMVAYILNVDPQQDEAKIRLTFHPEGDLSKDGLSSIWNLKLIAPEAICSGSGGWVFERGMPLASVDLSFVLLGQVNDYPFDKHSAQLILALNRTDPDLRVPSTVLIKGGVHGYHIELEPITGFPRGINAMKMTVTRSSTVQEAAIASMAVMWAIGIGVFALIILMPAGWYNVRMPAFFAALLFGLYGLRNSLPGTPPIGAYSDFLSFLWVQGIVALALLVSIIATFKRRPI
ncbi:MAG: DUF4436 family protein [Methanothrix sp.]|nr:DUF4436 family protein [Methanothrix sp.]